MIKKSLTLVVALALGALLGSIITIFLLKNSQTQSQTITEQTSGKEVATTNINYEQLPAINISEKQSVATFKKFYSSANINELTLKIDHHKYIYELDGFDEVKDCTLKIDAETGKILGQSTLRRDDHENDLEAIDFKQTISKKEAGQIAINKIGRGKAVSWKLTINSQQDFPIWQVNVANGSEVHEVKLNALNKEIIE